MVRTSRLLSPFVAFLLCGPACIGSIDGGAGGGAGPRGPIGPGSPGGPGTPGTPGGGNTGTMPANPGSPSGPGLPGSSNPGAPADPNAAGPQPLRRLDRREFNNTVRDLLGDNTRPADRFPSDRDSEFTFTHAGLVSSQDYSTIQDAAESLAAAAEKDVGTLAPCPAPPEEACARSFATSFGLRAYRRPLVDREIDSLVQVYREARGAPLSLPHAGGIRLMIQGILQSPAFLYHWESGPNAPAVEGKVVRLDHYQNASQLSYFLWGSMPDGPLLEAAAGRKLGTQAELEAQARRMLDDPRARETVSEFVEQWLGLDQVLDRPKDPKLYPDFTEPLKQAMIAEARAFVSNVVFDGPSTLSTLLTANFGFVNQPLAAVYGLTGVQGMEMKRADLSADQRAGLLTQAAFLTVTGATDGSHPVKRGKKVFERLLCGELPPPPADVPPPKPASEGGTTRERFADHGSNACAVACHANLDPLGFAFEHYDGIGKYRTMDNGGQVDASGSFLLDGQMKRYQNARELVQALAGSETVRSCFATQWTRFALRRFETEGDRASLEGLRAGFTRTGGNIRDLMVGVVGARSFRYRAPADGEDLK